MPRPKQNARKKEKQGGGARGGGDRQRVAFVEKQLSVARTKSHQDNKRALTPEEVEHATNRANELFTKKKAEEDEGISVCNLMNYYCGVIANKGALCVCKGPTHTERVTMSLTTLAGEEFTAAGATKTEASEAMLRWSEVFSFLSVVDTCTF